MRDLHSKDEKTRAELDKSRQQTRDSENDREIGKPGKLSHAKNQIHTPN